VSIAVVLGALFLVGTAEVFVDTAAGTLMPMLVDKRDLGVGQARLQTGFVALNQLAGAPIGAVMFATGRALPFGAQVVTVLLAAVLVTRIALPRGRCATRATATCGATSPKGSAGCWDIRRCAPWRSSS
jgi:fucose permease